MSQQGYLVWYTESAKLDVGHLLLELPKLMEFQRATRVVRYTPEYDDPKSRPTAETEELIGENILAKELYKLHVPGSFMSIHLDESAMIARIEDSIKQGVPQRVRGKFLPDRPFIDVGKHYLHDDALEKVIARPRLSLGCWGYSSAEDWQEMRRLTFALPEFRQETHRLEHLIGELRHVLYWRF